MNRSRFDHPFNPPSRDIVPERSASDTVEGHPFSELPRASRVRVGFEAIGNDVSEPEGVLKDDVRERGYLTLTMNNGEEYVSNDRIESLIEVTGQEWQSIRGQIPASGAKFYIAQMHHGRIWLTVFPT